MEAAFPQQFLRHDDDVMPCQRRTDDRMRTGYIIGQAVTRFELDAPPLLLEVRSSFRLEMYLDVRMIARSSAGNGVRDPMLAHLDLTEFQPRNRRVANPRVER